MQTALSPAGYEARLLSEKYFTLRLRDRRFDGVVREAMKAKAPLPEATIARIDQAWRDRKASRMREVEAQINARYGAA